MKIPLAPALFIFLFFGIANPPVFSQKNDRSPDAEKLWQLVATQLDKQPADTSRQFVLLLVRGHCGSDPGCLYQIYDTLRNKLERRFDLQAAIFVCQEMAVIAQQHGNLDWQGNAHRNIYRYYNAMGNYPKAIRALEKAKDCFDRAGNRSRAMYCKISFLEITSKFSPFDEVYLSMCSLILEAEETRDTANLVGLHIRLLDMTSHGSHMELAQKHIDDLEKLVPHLNPKSSYWYGANTSPLRARAEIAIGNRGFNEAKRLYLSVLQFCEQEPDRWGEIETLTNLAQMDWKLGEKTGTKTYLEKAEKKAQALNLTELLTEIFELKSEIAEAEGRFADALGAKKMAIFHKTEFEKESKGFSFQAHYLELEKEKLNVEKAKFQAESELKTSQLLASIAVLFLMVLLAVGLFRANRFQKKTTEKLAEQNALIQKQSQVLQNLDAAKSQFFANISHELRTPLSLILGPIASILKENQLAEKQKRLLKMAAQNGSHLQHLVNEILDLGKLEAGKMSVNAQPTELVPFFRSYLAKFKSLAAANRVHFSFEILMENGATAKIDQSKYRQILSNLLANAFKFTPAGGSVTVVSSHENDRFQLNVADTGTGIAAADLPHVFDRYFQTKNSAGGGTGIGLALCNELAQLLGGTISARSQVGEGSVFEVNLPLILEKEARKMPKTEEAGFAFSENIAPAVLAKAEKKTSANPLPGVLVVEDNAELRDYIRLILEEKYTVFTAKNGQEALNYLTPGPSPKERGGKMDTSPLSFGERPGVRLIISDLMMPVMDGYELLEKVKSDDATRHLPFVMLTARADAPDKLKALRLGVDDYLSKPFVEEELLARIENLLKNQSGRQQFFEKNKRENEAPVFSKEDQTWLSDFEKYVEKNLADPDLAVPRMASDFAMSESSLLRQLKRLTGLSAVQYLQEVRLNKARLLLENRVFKNLEKVVAEVGYGDVRNFSRSFKKRFGRSPSDWLGG